MKRLGHNVPYPSAITSKLSLLVATTLAKSLYPEVWKCVGEAVSKKYVLIGADIADMQDYAYNRMGAFGSWAYQGIPSASWYEKAVAGLFKPKNRVLLIT